MSAVSYMAGIDDLVRRHGPGLTRYALRLGVAPADADDLVQSVWSTVLEQPDRFEGRSRISTFLFGILRNKARGLWRSRRSNAPVEPDDGYSIESELLAREQMPILQDCADSLSANARMALASDLGGSSKQSVAKKLAVPVNRLYVILHRAKHHLFDCMDHAS